MQLISFNAIINSNCYLKKYIFKSNEIYGINGKYEII